MMKQRTGLIAGGLMAAALTLGSAPALAADSNSKAAGDANQGGQQQKQEQDPVSDAKLKQFADAAMEMRSVRAEYGPKLQNAESDEERAKLKKEGQGKMKEAIRSSGMEVAEYKRIGRRLNQDKELQQRLQQMMKKQMQKGSGGQQPSSGGQQPGSN